VGRDADLGVFSETNMSRSYHVTRRAAIRAFAEGDTMPAALALEKAWVKKAENVQ
jgi:hypothetical protein